MEFPHQSPPFALWTWMGMPHLCYCSRITSKVSFLSDYSISLWMRSLSLQSRNNVGWHACAFLVQLFEPVGSLESMQESSTNQLLKSSMRLSGKCNEVLKDGYIIALYARDRPALHVSRQRVKGGGWFLDSLSNVSKRDPAAQFLIIFRSKVCFKGT